MIGIIGGSGVYEITSKADGVEKKIVNTDYGDVEVSILDIFSKSFPHNLVLLLRLLLEGGALLCLHTLSGGGVEDDLTESDGLGRYLDKLLIGDEFNSLLKRELNGCDESELFIGAGRTNSGKMLLLTNVYLNVIGLGVLTNDHTLINRGSRTDEERTSVLRLIETVGSGDTLL